MSMKKFVVSATSEPSNRSFAPTNITIMISVGGPFLAAIAATISRFSSEDYQWAIITLLFLVILFVTTFRRKKPDATSQVAVTVYPMGVQLARLESDRPVKPPLFIPRDIILDVIVNEMILAHKVVSVVLFRVWKRDETTQQATTSKQERSEPPGCISSLLKEGRIHLVPAFPGVEMSYRECLMMRREISVSLGLM